jgi:hypothetical protein
VFVLFARRGSGLRATGGVAAVVRARGREARVREARRGGRRSRRASRRALEARADVDLALRRDRDSASTTEISGGEFQSFSIGETRVKLNFSTQKNIFFDPSFAFENRNLAR